MVKMSAYFKTVLRTVKNNVGRFVAITFIVLLGIAFVTGLGTLSYKIEISLSESYRQQNFSDVIIKNTSTRGFSTADAEKAKEISGIAEVEAITAIDTEIDGLNGRVYVLPMGETKINKINLIEGKFPENQNEIAVEQSSVALKKYSLGEDIKIKINLGSFGFGSQVTEMEVKVVGIVKNPLHMYKGEEPYFDAAQEFPQNDSSDLPPLKIISYLNLNSLPKLYQSFLPKTDLWVKCKDMPQNMFEDGYITAVEKVIAEIKTNLGEENLVYLTAEENTAYAIAKSYNKKIDVISLIFPLFFIIVAALVVLTTMSRLIEEERAAIGCYKTLGISNAKIAWKYIMFSLLCSILGGGIGLGIGLAILPYAIYPSFNALFFMPPMTLAADLTMGLIAMIAMTLATIGVTAYLIAKDNRMQPADLLRPKAPKAGKKIFLEHVSFIWKHLSFKYKSTYRNIFRYVKHLLMTVFSVAGSTALVLAGFGLLDVSNADDLAFDVSIVADSLSLIAAVIILFAVLLCILVIFNLTNMNIGERKREIATLKVLGYRDFEVSGYIFREIFIMAVFGVIIGLPLGYGLMAFVFSYLDFGSVFDVKIWSYFFAPLLVVVVVGIVDWMLYYKIKKINMTDSLKTVE